MTVAKYRKKPVVIEAMLWEGGSIAASNIVGWIIDGGHAAKWREEKPEVRVSNGELAQLFEPEHIRIRTLEGDIKASTGDYIIKGVRGEFYPCKPDIFAATYEVAGHE
jgi:hypothetical protein